MTFEKSEISTGSSNVSREPEFEKSVHGGEPEEKESPDVLSIRDDIQFYRKNELNNINLVRLSAEDVSIVNKQKDRLDKYMDELNQRITKLKVSPEKKQELIEELERFITDANKEFELYGVYSSKVPKTYMQLNPLYPIIEPEEEPVWEEIEVPSEEQLQKEKNAELGIEADIESFKNNFGSGDAIGALLMQSVPERLEWQRKADERIGEINIKIDFNISEENRPALRKKLDDLIKNINEKLQKFKVYNSNIIENILQLLPPLSMAETKLEV